MDFRLRGNGGEGQAVLITLRDGSVSSEIVTPAPRAAPYGELVPSQPEAPPQGKDREPHHQGVRQRPNTVCTDASTYSTHGDRCLSSWLQREAYRTADVNGRATRASP